ncbi:hypothetical protein [Nocardia araoensis]|uniref:hypothetical protein n=1 Tax=Nocardia araoensis TaxID=228600 RepID=UPI001FDFEF51|nr:hypothetical protein [Nocardia araoensis]
MSSDERTRRKNRKPTKPASFVAQTKPSSDDHHDVVYFRRRADGTIPGRDYLRALPAGVRAKFNARLIAVAKAPPKRFAGGGYWEAMHGNMTGWFELRCDGPDRTHHRLYCRLDYEAERVDKPLLVIITGLNKPFRTTLSDSDYARVRALGAEYFAENPRSIS